MSSTSIVRITQIGGLSDLLELKYDELIKEFGIPNNYMSHKPVIGGIRKIMFVRDKESQR